MGRLKGLSPTQRTLKELRNRGMLCDKVERWNQFAGPHGVRHDMFGFGDLVALDPEQKKIIAVQCCAGSGFAAHRRKITEECNEAAHQWLLCGGLIELWAWRKIKLQRGGKAERWSPRVEVITLESLPQLAARGGDA